MKTCKKCNKQFPTYVKVNGKTKNLSKRSYCLECVPFGAKPGRKATDNVMNDERTEKKCSTCLKMKPISEYYVRSDHGKRGTARSECRSCLTDYLIARYHKHKLEAIEMLGGECADCHQKFRIEVYDFHHINPSEKELDWRKIRQCSKEKREAELKKCVVLCSNCHRIRHAEHQDKLNSQSDSDST